MGKTDTISELLGRNAKIDEGKEESIFTPLAMAAHNGQCEAMRLLLSRDADVNAMDKNEGPVINVAIGSGNPSAVDLLLDHGAILSVEPGPDGSYNSPLTEAALAPDSTIFDALLDKFTSKLSPRDYDLAFKTGKPDIMEKLLPLLPEDHDFQQDLDSAVERGDFACISFLIRNEIGRDMRWDAALLLLVKGGSDKTETLDDLSAIWTHAGDALSSDTLNEALYTAADKEKEQTVRLLLETFEVDSNATGEE